MKHNNTPQGATNAKNESNATNTPAAPAPAPVTAREKAAALLAPYTAPRALLKEWTKADTGREFDKLQEEAAADLAHFFGRSFKFTAGSRPNCGDDFRAYEVGDLFGLPYTSSGKYAAIWNANTEARARSPLFPLFFKGIAIQPRKNAKYKTFDFIYIFLADTDAGENWYYFTDSEYLKIENILKDLNRAEALADFIKSINEITPRVVEVLRSYNGKKCGEKTREKMRGELNAITEATAPRVRLWLDLSQYSPAFRFSYNYNTFEKIIYYNFYDAKTNTINTPEEAPAPLKEFDAVQALADLETKANEAQKAAAALLPALEEYNAAARLLSLPSLSGIVSTVSTLAKHGAIAAARN